MNWPDDDMSREVLQRLDQLENSTDRPTGLTRSENRRLVQGWRLLLSVHHPDLNGSCKVCGPADSANEWLCPLWMLAYEQLATAEPVPDQLSTRTTVALTRSAPIPPESAAEVTTRIPVIPTTGAPQVFTVTAPTGANILPPLLLSAAGPAEPPPEAPSWPASSLLSDLPSEPALAQLGGMMFDPVFVQSATPEQPAIPEPEADEAAVLRQTLEQYWADSPAAS